MKLYVVRHGESETNLIRHWTGWTNVNLTEKGREDARTAGKYLQGIPFDKIYSSDLNRAMQTAQIAVPGCIPEETILLREINVGNIAGHPIDDNPPEQRKHFNEVGYSDVGGETREDFYTRIREFLNHAASLDCETVAAFCHRGWMVGLFEILTEVPFPRNCMRCGNCAIAVLEYENGIWYLNSWINP